VEPTVTLRRGCDSAPGDGGCRGHRRRSHGPPGRLPSLLAVLRLHLRPRAQSAAAATLVVGLLALVALAPAPARPARAQSGTTAPTLNSTIPSSDAAVTVTTGLRYYEGGPTYDAYVPTDDRTDRPALIMVHGGGWAGGQQSELAPYAEDAATEEGWAAFTVDYRLDGSDPSSWADELHDVQSAVRAIAADADRFGIDPGKVVLLGDSAGANLVALVSEVGTVEPITGSPVGVDRSSDVPIRAVALWSPPTDLGELAPTRAGADPSGCGSDDACDFVWDSDAIADYLHCDPTTCPDTASAASPISHVSASTAPSYIANSTEELVPLSQVEAYVDALRADGVEVRLDVVPGSLHAAQLGPQVWPASKEFLARHVGSSAAGATDTTAAAGSGASSDTTAPAATTGDDDGTPWGLVVALVVLALVVAGAAVAVVARRRSPGTGPGSPADR